MYQIHLFFLKKIQKWLFNEIVKDPNERSSIASNQSARRRSRSTNPEHKSQDLSASNTITDLKAAKEDADPETIPTSKEPIIKTPNSNDQLAVRLQVEDTPSNAVQQVLNLVEDYNFPIFELVSLSNNHSLFYLSRHLVVDSGLLSKLELPVDKFLRCMKHIEAGYRSELPCNVILEDFFFSNVNY